MPACVTALCVLSLSAPAQELGSAAVNGTVMDDSGAAVPQAAVLLHDNGRGLDRTTSTNLAGRFAFPTVPAGSYILRVSKQGFDAHEITNFNVAVGQRAAVDVVLKVGDVSTVLTVSGERSILLETESNTVGTVVDSARLEELPLNGRNFLQLALLAAGSNDAVGRAAVADQTGHPGREVVIGGNLAGATGYTVNGIAVRGGRLGELALSLSVAGIDQFKVQQSFFMPDQGPNPGLVNVTTKGGGNGVHGQAFEFVRNQIMDARNFFAPAPENLHRNQFGFAIGGPIVKDRIWFYGNYEGLRNITAFSARAYTPTQAMFGGDMREVLPAQIYDPATYSPDTGRRLPFANNLIPANRINPVSKRLLDYYIPGTSLTQTQNVFRNPRNTLTDDQASLRVDAALTQRQNIFGQMIYQTSPAVQPGIMPLTGLTYPLETQLGMVQHTFTVRANLVNTLRVGMVRNLSLQGNQGRDSGVLLPQIGIQNAYDDRGITGISFQEYSGFGRADGDLGNIDNSYQADEGVNYTRGTHNLQFGASVRYMRTWQQNANGAAHGNLGFQPTFSAQLAPDKQGRPTPVKGTGNSFADFLLGMNTTGNLKGLPMLPYRYSQVMPYLQDTWKLNRTLTLNYGISWFFATVPDPQGFARQMAHGFDPRTGLLTYAALGEIDPKLVRTRYGNFTPRMGLAWQPRFLPHTVVRGGVGVYYSDTRLLELQFGMTGPPFADGIDAINTPTDPFPKYVLGLNLFPPTPTAPLDKNYAATVQNSAPRFINPDGRTPYMQQWNLSIQHTFGGNNLLELAYLGSSNHRLQNRYDSNQCAVGPDLYCDKSKMPYWRYTSLATADFNGNSSYNAMLTKLEHRLAAGLSARFEYTFAKAMDDAYEGGGTTNNQIVSCRRCDKSVAAFDVRHRAVLSALYDLPFGKGRRFSLAGSHTADLALGGWTVTSIATFQTGNPFVISTPSRAGASYADNRPNRVCDGSNPSLAGDLRGNGFRYFDTGCFQLPATGYFGNSGRNVIYGPGRNNFDVGIQKYFPVPLREGMRLQFRGELFNAFNHAQFNDPNGNVGNSNFGKVMSAKAPRLVQLGLKLLF